MCDDDDGPPRLLSFLHSWSGYWWGRAFDFIKYRILRRKKTSPPPPPKGGILMDAYHEMLKDIYREDATRRDVAMRAFENPRLLIKRGTGTRKWVPPVGAPLAKTDPDDGGDDQGSAL